MFFPNVSICLLLVGSARIILDCLRYIWLLNLLAELIFLGLYPHSFCISWNLSSIISNNKITSWTLCKSFKAKRFLILSRMYNFFLILIIFVMDYLSFKGAKKSLFWKKISHLLVVLAMCQSSQFFHLRDKG